MAYARTPGPLQGPEPWQGREHRKSAVGGVAPGPSGLRFSSTVFAIPAAITAVPAKGKALIILGTSQPIRHGVRYSSDHYLKLAALNTFAAKIQGLTPTVEVVKSPEQMKQLIASGHWDVVIYFGHGVNNKKGLQPNEKRGMISEKDLTDALRAAHPKTVYLYGCRAGFTGLARALSADLPGTTVFATFPSLDAAWDQGKTPGKSGKFYNKFEFKAPLTEYTNGFQTKNGKKTKERRAEMGDPLIAPHDPLGEPMIKQ